MSERGRIGDKEDIECVVVAARSGDSVEQVRIPRCTACACALGLSHPGALVCFCAVIALFILFD